MKEITKLENPLISVIVPMYNAEKVVTKCLEHLTHQTYKKLEIIIVDDGSKDNSVKVICEYAKKDKRIKIIKQKNSGSSVARNTGLDATKGEYVHFHDCDDFVNLDYFEKMANAIKITDADILCGEVNQPTYPFPRFNAIEICLTNTDKINKTKANVFRPAWRYVYKKSFLNQNKIRFIPKVVRGEDLFFTQRTIILAKTVALVPGAIYNVVNTKNSLGKRPKNTITAEQHAAAKNARQELQKFFKQNNVESLMTAKLEPETIKKYKVFNGTIFKKAIFTNKIRYYFLGINIGTLHIRTQEP